MTRRPFQLIVVIGPGILVAATGVGAGDILTAALGGSALGLVILWAALVGALLKYGLNEGIARWQMATDSTIMEGWYRHLGPAFSWLFFLYLLVWTFFTGGALITACGVAGHALLPCPFQPVTSKIIWGLIHTILGFTLVKLGGYKLFERMMSVFIVIMFVAVVLTASLIAPDIKQVFTGMVFPGIPSGGIGWIVGILGGVGGTVTLLSYGYWIREEGRAGFTGLRTSRIDLAVGYTMTAIFGICMIIIGSQVTITGSGVAVGPVLAGQLEAGLGSFGKWLFLAGFWGAVFSSLLGVWQSVPYMFADFLVLNRSVLLKTGRDIPELREKAYGFYLLFITIVPIPLLWISVKKAQLIYAVTGAFFMPILALTLLYLNNRKLANRKQFRNGWWANSLLCVTLGFFIYVGIRKLLSIL